MQKNKDIVIAGLVTLSLIGGMYYLFFRKKTIMSNKKLSLGNSVIVSVPDTKMSKYPLLVIFGGISYATPEWMYSKIPKDILYKSIVVIAPYNLSYDTVKKKYEDFFAKNNILIKDTSLFGFSAGGLQVQKAYSPDFKLVGMIDPSLRPEYASKKYDKNVILSMNLGNWAGVFSSFDYKKEYANLKDSIAKSGGTVEDIKKPHGDFPNYFFEKYKQKII